MSDHSDRLELQSEREIDRIAHEFDQALRRSEQPRIEDILHAQAAPEVPLLRELVLTECEYHAASGSPVDWAGYASRFPQHADLLNDWQREFAASADGTFDTTQLAELDSAAPTQTPLPVVEVASSDSPLAPLDLADFEFDRRLGKGGQGEVFLAHQKSLDRPVAIKQLNASVCENSESVRRFVREARTIAQTRHPHIVTVHGIGRADDGSLFLVMEYVEGPDLAAQIAEKPFDVREAVEIVSRIAEAVAHAHQRGVIHRDLKPRNILWDSLRGPVVTDFGLAKDLRDAEELTLTEQIMGTPAYMAPEQAHRRFGPVSERTDVYGLGAILFALLTGRGPYSGLSLGETLHALSSDDPTPDARSVRSEIPTDVAAICDRCLAKFPERRFASAQELAERLSDWLPGKSAAHADRPAPQRAWRKVATDSDGQRMFGSYRLIHRIDSDTERMIYRAVAADGRQVLLKQLPEEWLSDRQKRSHFRQEVLLATRLRHPSLAQFVDAGTVGRTEYLAVEFTEGESVAQVLQRNGAMSEQKAAEILHPIAEVLQLIHEAGVVYRDLRPQNILLNPAGKPVLADIRFSTELAFGDNATMMGWGPVSSLYLAPELLMGRPSTPASDVYSLGTTLYALVTGHPPFENAGNSIAQMIQKSNGEYTPARQFAPDLSDAIVQLIDEAMSDAPGNRPASAAVFAERLTNYLPQCSGDADIALPTDDSLAVEPPTEPLVLHENAQFSVYRPKAVRPDQWERLLAFAHLADLPPDAAAGAVDPIEEVRRQAEQVLGNQAASFRQLTSDAGQPVPHAGELTFVPSGDGLEFNPPSRTFRWLEAVHREEFRFRADAGLDGRMARGRLSVFLGTILIAEVNLVTRVSRQTDAVTDGDLSSRNSAFRFRRIYACVSPEDTGFAEQFADYESAMRDAFLTLDRNHGDVAFDDKERQQIRSADVFQLYWSSRAMNSPDIEQRWRFALGLNRPDFIRSLYWEEPFPADPARSLPPAELLALGFQKVRVASSDSKATSGTLMPSIRKKLLRVRAPRRDSPNCRLEVMSGTAQGRIFTLSKDRVTIGRHSDCDVPLPTILASRFQAQFLREDGQWFVEDLQSRGGTFVNGQAISGRTVLRSGDLIHVADVVLAFRMHESSDAEPDEQPSLLDGIRAVTPAAGSKPEKRGAGLPDLDDLVARFEEQASDSIESGEFGSGDAIPAQAPNASDSTARRTGVSPDAASKSRRRLRWRTIALLITATAIVAYFAFSVLTGG